MTKTAVAIIAAIALVAVAWKAGEPRAQLTPFTITIERTATGDSLQCSQGCAWKTASFVCRSASPCRWQVDENGLRSFKNKKDQ